MYTTDQLICYYSLTCTILHDVIVLKHTMLGQCAVHAVHMHSACICAVLVKGTVGSEHCHQ